MIEGTRRAVLETLLEGEKSATGIADELGVSVQTVYRHLQMLADDGYVRQQGTRSAATRPRKLYRAVESAHLFALLDGELVERTLQLAPGNEALIRILSIPQAEFHPVLASHLFERVDGWSEFDVRAVGVYGSVARGDADEESDVDVLVVAEERPDGGFPERTAIYEPVLDGFGSRRVVSETWLSRSEFEEGLEAGSQFVESVLEDVTRLYDPEGILGGPRIPDDETRSTGRGVPE